MRPISPYLGMCSGGMTLVVDQRNEEEVDEVRAPAVLGSRHQPAAVPVTTVSFVNTPYSGQSISALSRDNILADSGMLFAMLFFTVKLRSDSSAKYFATEKRMAVKSSL